MATKTIDFAETRARLQRELGEAQEELVSVEGRLGGLTLDLELGAGSQADVERARAQRQQLSARISELQAALDKLDEREAEHAAAEAEAARARDAARMESCLKECAAAGGEVVRLARELAAACASGHRAANEAAALARRIDANPGSVRHWPRAAGVVIVGRLHEAVPGFPGGVRQPVQELVAAEVTLTGEA